MTTPMFEQYHRLKAQHPDALLFFRMGDFYELFFDDAREAARLLEITLTTRNKRDPDPIPMAGVPHHAAAAYIQRLTDAGRRVAIAEQVEDPATAKGLVRREIVQVVTPGVVFDSRALDQRVPNYLGAITMVDGRVGVAVLDCSTGDFMGTETDDLESALGELCRLEPREILVGPGVAPASLKRWLKGVAFGPPIEGSFEEDAARRCLKAQGLPIPEGGALVRAAGAALAYGRAMSGGPLPHVHTFRRWETRGFMVLDPATRRNLELVRTQRTQKRRGSLLHLLDRTRTAMGGRKLREWVGFPLMDLARIEQRQRAIAALVDDLDVRQRLEEALLHVADVERILARITQNKANARELVALATSLEAVPSLAEQGARLPALGWLIPTDLLTDVRDTIRGWLVDEPPLAITEGGMIREGAHPELDRLIRLSVEGAGLLGRVEEQARAESRIPTLKLKRNKVFGYFFEVGRAHLHKVPADWIRKQTLSNAERFITQELKELEQQVLGADERRRQLEFQLFQQLRERVAAEGTRLAALARRIAELDAVCSLAEVAADRGWTCPKLDTSRTLDIREGRHPVVEAMLEDGSFVPNDLAFTPSSELIVLTGPNMAGKSTVMRQVALIVLLAQMGSFVPAERARIGRVDRIFTRVGASDDLTAGQSTFMVEMAETATILHEATEHSLVLLDEIGRGTSTYDGLAIAWAVAEDLADRCRSRTLFATHYHELCELASTRSNVINLSIAVAEQGDAIIFLRRLKKGGASRSYGIQCARLAGLPETVLERARSLLRHFEKHAPRNDREQLSLFGGWGVPAEAPPKTAPPVADPIREAVAALDPDSMSPRDALRALYDLKALLDG